MRSRTVLSCLAPPALAVALFLAAGEPGCSCAPSQQCQLIRALCKIDLCIKTDRGGWARCQDTPEGCDVDSCFSRADCMADFMARCAARMAPGTAGHAAYSRCTNLDCSTPAGPPPAAAPDAQIAPPPDAASTCAGVMCDGACCTAYPCFSGKRCTCLPSVAACFAPDAGAPGPAITPACCSDSPLCSSQGKLCCFIPATEAAPAQTRCLSSCPESRHCTFAPYLQPDGTRSCLPPPYDSAGVLCPF